MLPFRRKAVPSAIMLGDQARAAGAWEVAAQHYRIELSRNPENAAIWVQYGHALKESGRLVAAEAAYRQALDAQPHMPDAHVQLGHALKLQGRIEEARFAYLRALALDPNWEPARHEMTAFTWQDEELADARREIERAAAAKRAAASTITQADRERDLGHWEAAARLYRRALDRNPRRAEIWVQCGHVLKEGAQFAAAEAAYRRALTVVAQSAEIYLQLGHVLKLQSKADDAQAAYLRAFVLDPTLSSVSSELRASGWTAEEISELVVSLTLSEKVATVPRTLENGCDGHDKNRQWPVEIPLRHPTPANDEERVIFVPEAAVDKPQTDQEENILRASGLFDAAWYLRSNPDVRASDIDPLMHYLRYGASEGRDPHPLFNTIWYLERNPDVAADGINPFIHYLTSGGIEGRDPHPLFAGGWYLEHNPDVAASGINPLIHYLNFGGTEGRDPHPLFDGRRYLARNPDVAASGINPLVHYLDVGAAEGVEPNRFIDKILRLINEDQTTPIGLNPLIHYVTKLLPDRAFEYWFTRYEMVSNSDRAAIAQHIADFTILPSFSVVVPVYNTPEQYLRQMIDSVIGQLYPHWQLCLADDASTAPHVQAVLREFSELDPRIMFVTRPVNGNICAATNTALELATGEFVALLDHDDLLAETALYEVAVELNRNPDADVIYSDSDSIDDTGQHLGPYFKTDWDPDLMLGHNMVSHLGVYRRSMLQQLGGMRLGFEGSQDYDLMLRAAEATTAAKIRHIPALLYHWRRKGEMPSFSEASLERCVAAARRAIRQHLERRGVEAHLDAPPKFPEWTRVVYALPRVRPLVSIVVPTRDRADLLARCADGVLARTAYEPLELLIVDNDSVEPETHRLFERLTSDPRVRLLRHPGPFNYAAINNHAVREARGDVVVLLNNDVDPISSMWLDELVSHALRPEVGAVGAKLLYPDGRVQHAGVVLGPGHGAGHLFPGATRDEVGHSGFLVMTRRVSAVTAACLATRRVVFQEIGGFDEVNFPVAFNDVDLCLRIGERGYSVVWTPYAELWHNESATRGHDADDPERLARLDRDAVKMRQRWGDLLDCDPFYNQNCEIGGTFAPAYPPRRRKPWRQARPHRNRAPLPPEPHIKPAPLVPVPHAALGEISLQAAALLKEIPFQPLPTAEDAHGNVRQRYLAAKIALLDRNDGFREEFQAALAARAAEGLDALLETAGIMPLRGVGPDSSDVLPGPILQRYRAEQLRATRRFSLDHGRIGAVAGGPRISILMPVYRTPLAFLERAILSVVCQSYANWELCIADDCSNDVNVTAILEYYATRDVRIRVAQTPKTSGISRATNLALAQATGSYIGLLDHDDMLTHDALELVAAQLADPTVDFVYTDECKIDEYDIAGDLFSKPDWSPMLLTAFMYTGHFTVYRASLVHDVGAFRSRYDFSQDYDLALRIADGNPVVRHVGECLYGWRMIAGSAAVGDKPDARNSNIAALQDAMDRRGWNGRAIALPTANRARRNIVQNALVSIVIPTGGKFELLQGCLSAICGRSTYRNIEIIVIHNTGSNIEGVSHDPRVSIIDATGPFNFSKSCNIGAAAASGDFVIFYNDDVVVITPDWIEAILECLTLDGVGAVSPKLLYEDERIQHAGMVTGTRRLLGTAFHLYPRTTTAHVNLAQSTREVSLLSGACLAMAKPLFDQLGGFDEINTPREHSDVDLCFRIRELGYRCVYTPHAELYHLGHVSMGEAERAGKLSPKGKHDLFLLKYFGSYVADDPFFPRAMRDLLYADSPEEFSIFPRNPTPELPEPFRAARLPGAAAPAPSAGEVTKDILVVSHDLTESGAPRAAFDVARSLRAAGHYVVVLSPTDGPYRERLQAAGVDVIIDTLVFHQRADFLHFARNFDKVIFNTIICWPAIGQLLGIVDLFWYIHESSLIRRLAEALPAFPEILRSGVPIWAASRFSARHLQEFGIDPRILEYGIEDRSRLQHASRNDKDIVIGVFGSYEPRKGQDLAIAGMLQLPEELRRRARIQFFGRTLEVDRGFRRDIEAAAADDPSIVFNGEIDHEECLRQMAASDIILVPSRDDTLPFVTLDALSMGKPLICSRTTGTSEYLEEGVAGLVLQENNPTEIAATLARVIADANLRETLAAGARRVYEQHFTVAGFTANLHAALGLDS